MSRDNERRARELLAILDGCTTGDHALERDIDAHVATQKALDEAEARGREQVRVRAEKLRASPCGGTASEVTWYRAALEHLTARITGWSAERWSKEAPSPPTPTTEQSGKAGGG